MIYFRHQYLVSSITFNELFRALWNERKDEVEVEGVGLGGTHVFAYTAAGAGAKLGYVVVS